MAKKKKPAEQPVPTAPEAEPVQAEPEAVEMDETPVVSTEFSSAALALLVRVLNDAKPDGTVEIKDLARGSVCVVVTPKAKKAAK